MSVQASDSASERQRTRSDDADREAVVDGERLAVHFEGEHDVAVGADHLLHRDRSAVELFKVPIQTLELDREK